MLWQIVLLAIQFLLLVFICATKGCLLLLVLVIPLDILVLPLIRRHALILLLPYSLLLVYLDCLMSFMLELVFA